MPYTYEFPRAMVTVDAVVFSIQDKEDIRVLLIQRGQEPFKGRWAFPGGFMDMDEDLEHAVVRELEEESGLKGIELKQLHTFSKLGRDPRGRTVSTAFIGLMSEDRPEVRADDDAKDARWFPVDDLPKLAFDHADIIKVAFGYLEREHHIKGLR